MNKSLLSKRSQLFESSGIRKIFNMAASLKDPINFSIGQPDFGPSDAVKQKTIEAINNNLSQYTLTQGIIPLREKIVNKFAKENNIQTDIDQILVTSGTSACIFLTLAVTLDPGDEVIIPDPYFFEYTELVKYFEAKPVLLNTYPNFQLDPNALEKLITLKTKVIIINSPNNPTGAVYSEQSLKKVAELARKHNLIILSDEIYEKFVYDGLKHFSIGSVYENTITVGGPAKSNGMPGWRLGWANGPQEIITKMAELQQYTFVCAPYLVQHGVMAIFDEDFSQRLSEYQFKRDLIYNLLSQKFEIIKPHGAFYIMPKVKNGTKFVEAAIKDNVLIIPSRVFSSQDSHIRISFATSLEKIKKGCEILLSN